MKFKKMDDFEKCRNYTTATTENDDKVLNKNTTMK